MKTKIRSTAVIEVDLGFAKPKSVKTFVDEAVVIPKGNLNCLLDILEGKQVKLPEGITVNDMIATLRRMIRERSF